MLHIIALQGHCNTITLSLWAFSYTAAIYRKTAGFDKCGHLLYRLTTATAVYYYYYYCYYYYGYYYYYRHHHHHPTDHYKMTVDMSRDYNKSQYMKYKGHNLHIYTNTTHRHKVQVVTM